MKDKTDHGLDFVRIQLVKDRTLVSEDPVTNAEDAVKMVGEMVKWLDREMLAVLNMKVNGQVMNVNVVSVGSVNSSIAGPREVFKSAILSNAAYILLVHNHPSGTPYPSQIDIEVTKRMMDSGKLLGIPVIDHVIIGAENGDIFSFREHEVIPELESIAEGVLKDTGYPDFIKGEAIKLEKKKEGRQI